MNWDKLVAQCKLKGNLTVRHGGKIIDAEITTSGTVVADGEEFTRPSVLWNTHFPNRVSVCEF